MLEPQTLISKDFPEPLAFHPFLHFQEESPFKSDFLSVLDDDMFLNNAVSKILDEINVGESEEGSELSEGNAIKEKMMEEKRNEMADEFLTSLYMDALTDSKESLPLEKKEIHPSPLKIPIKPLFPKESPAISNPNLPKPKKPIEKIPKKPESTENHTIREKPKTKQNFHKKSDLPKRPILSPEENERKIKSNGFAKTNQKSFYNSHYETDFNKLSSRVPKQSPYSNQWAVKILKNHYDIELQPLDESKKKWKMIRVNGGKSGKESKLLQKSHVESPGKKKFAQTFSNMKEVMGSGKQNPKNSNLPTISSHPKNIKNNIKLQKPKLPTPKSVGIHEVKGHNKVQKPPKLGFQNGKQHILKGKNIENYDFDSRKASFQQNDMKIEDKSENNPKLPLFSTNFSDILRKMNFLYPIEDRYTDLFNY